MKFKFLFQFFVLLYGVGNSSHLYLCLSFSILVTSVYTEHETVMLWLLGRVMIPVALHREMNFPHGITNLDTGRCLDYSEHLEQLKWQGREYLPRASHWNVAKAALCFQRAGEMMSESWSLDWPGEVAATFASIHWGSQRKSCTCFW